MATISVGEGSIMRPYRKVRIEHFPEGASQTFIVGDVLALILTADKGDKVGKAGADPAVIVGVAAEKASGTEGTKIAVWVADEEGEFQAHVQDTGALDADDVGDAFGIVEDTTNKIWRVDRSDTTATRVRIVKLLDLAADVNGRVVFKFLQANRLPFAS